MYFLSCFIPLILVAKLVRLRPELRVTSTYVTSWERSTNISTVKASNYNCKDHCDKITAPDPGSYIKGSNQQQIVGKRAKLISLTVKDIHFTPIFRKARPFFFRISQKPEPITWRTRMVPFEYWNNIFPSPWNRQCSFLHQALVPIQKWNTLLATYFHY